MAVDTLANALNALKVAELKGARRAVAKPASSLLRRVLALLLREHYIKSFEFVDDGKAGWFVIETSGKINKCAAIKPRFSVRATDWERWEVRYLPMREAGLLIVSTPRGLMTHREAKAQRLGGKLIAYVY